MYILGFDIGGTKCAVITAQWDDNNITILKKEKCLTDLSVSPKEMIEKLIVMADNILQLRSELEKIMADNIGKDVKTIHEDCERDNWMSAQEALEYGIIDGLLTDLC